MNGGAQAFSRSELLQAMLKVSIFSLATYFSVKWMMKQLDPTNKQKRSAAKKVPVISTLFLFLAWLGKN